jgi:hypothetical protein
MELTLFKFLELRCDLKPLFSAIAEMNVTGQPLFSEIGIGIKFNDFSLDLSAGYLQSNNFIVDLKWFL